MVAGFLHQDLRSAENELAILEDQLHKHNREVKGSKKINENDDMQGGASPSDILKRLLALQTTTDSIALAQDYLHFLESAPMVLSANRDDRINNGFENDLEMLLTQAELCDEIAHRVILKHADSILELCPTLYEKAYLPLFDYLREYLVTLLRQKLQSSRYPTAKGCGELLGGKNSNSYIATICHHLSRLESTHKQVLQSVEGVNVEMNENSVFLEFFHPLLDRVYFHFIKTAVDDTGDQNNGNESPIMATRLDRLPECLLNYIKNNFLQDDGPYHVIRSVMGPSSVFLFLQELIGLIQWVLVEQRKIFDDPAISGPQSNPQFLYQAVEQFLEFDTILMELLANSTSTNSEIAEASTNESFSISQFTGLMDTMVASNQEFFNWWIQRELESVSSTLFPEDDNISINVPKGQLATYISPRAELFCSLIRSVQLKASTLTAPGIYLREVAVPLCSQFVDALHATSVDLRNRLVQKDNRREQLEKDHFTSSDTRVIDSEKQRLVSNINEWVEIINGAQFASQILLSNDRTVSSQSDHDLGRFGRSLERLVEVMMDEFAITFVESTLIEHAKFANYLMLASHFLASPEHINEDMMGKDNLTAEINDTKITLQYFQEICDSVLYPGNLHDRDQDEGSFSSFAPLGMRTRVADRLVEKLLDVALDINSVTPDIWLEGATIFARDVNALLGSYSDITSGDRLLEVTRFMSMDYDSFRGLVAAIGGLVGSDTYLDIEELNADTTLSDEARCMLKAKNVNCSLEDAVSILNRRRS